MLCLKCRPLAHELGELVSTDRVHNEKERYVPFSAPPFREGDDQHQKQADRDRLLKAADQGATHEAVAAKAEGETQRHPEWLELVCRRDALPFDKSMLTSPSHALVGRFSLDSDLCLADFGSPYN